MFTFCWAVRQGFAGEPSSVKPRSGLALVFLSQVAPSTRNGANWESRDNVCTKFWRQLSNDVIDSVFVRHHWFGAGGVAAMMTDQLDSTSVFVACGPQFTETWSAPTEQNFTVILAYIFIFASGIAPAATTPVNEIETQQEKQRKTKWRIHEQQRDPLRGLVTNLGVRAGPGKPGKPWKIFEALEIPGNPGKALEFFLWSPEKSHRTLLKK